MIRARSRIGAVASILLFAVTLASASSCWGAPDKDLIVENRSSEVVVLFEDGVSIGLVHPGLTYRSTVPPFTGTSTYSVQSVETREVLSERTYTWDEIVREDGVKIVLQ